MYIIRRSQMLATKILNFQGIGLSAFKVSRAQRINFKVWELQVLLLKSSAHADLTYNSKSFPSLNAPIAHSADLPWQPWRPQLPAMPPWSTRAWSISRPSRWLAPPANGALAGHFPCLAINVSHHYGCHSLSFLFRVRLWTFARINILIIITMFQWGLNKVHDTIIAAGALTSTTVAFTADYYSASASICQKLILWWWWPWWCWWWWPWWCWWWRLCLSDWTLLEVLSRCRPGTARRRRGRRQGTLVLQCLTFVVCFRGFSRV